jgi:hypothetical protein
LRIRRLTDFATVVPLVIVVLSVMQMCGQYVPPGSSAVLLLVWRLLFNTTSAAQMFIRKTPTTHTLQRSQKSQKSQKSGQQSNRKVLHADSRGVAAVQPIALGGEHQ